MATYIDLLSAVPSEIPSKPRRQRRIEKSLFINSGAKRGTKAIEYFFRKTAGFQKIMEAIFTMH